MVEPEDLRIVAPPRRFAHPAGWRLHGGWLASRDWRQRARAIRQFATRRARSFGL